MKVFHSVPIGQDSITLYELLKKSTRAGLKLQREDGSYPPDKNGVYGDEMTPVRSTSKWLIALSKSYSVSGNEDFFQAGNRAASYLLEDSNRPHGYTFYARKTKNKDRCNQLVGQALPIRALGYAGEVLNRPELKHTAAEIFKLHPFNPRLGLWEMVEIDGTHLSYDRTLNHQLLFSGAGSFLAEEYPEIETEIQCHLDKLKQILQTRSNGIIRHYVRPSLRDVISTVGTHPRHWELLLNEVMHRVLAYSDTQMKKEIGYQPLNLFGLAWLKRNFPDHSIWTAGGKGWVIEDLFSEAWQSRIFDDDITYGTGQPGISTAIALHELTNAPEKQLKEWIRADIERMYNPNTGLLDNVENDPIGHAAGINRLSYLPDLELSFSF